MKKMIECPKCHTVIKPPKYELLNSIKDLENLASISSMPKHLWEKFTERINEIKTILNEENW